MKAVNKILLVSTGNNEEKLQQLESGFALHAHNRLKFEIKRLGMVKSLVQSYHELLLSIDDPDILVILCHYDVYPMLPPTIREIPPVIGSVRNQYPWMNYSIETPGRWLKYAIELTKQEDTGILGVAGASGLTAETAWWDYPELSGAVVHFTPKGAQFNVYGKYGRCLILDGICLMVRSSTYKKISPPSEHLTGFHFYDVDLCLRAHYAGLQNWTIPLLLVHDHSTAHKPISTWYSEHKNLIQAHGHSLPISVPKSILPNL